MQATKKEQATTAQNMDEEMSKLLAVKIIQTYTQLMKMQSET